ncbi:hypothetical protein M422DRAFT_65783 [Sphaerobolus stellatus SS14]|nr:hypothetical protein M422DRAFT_65783 [Sphaerobolus stellatus SS14]
MSSSSSRSSRVSVSPHSRSSRSDRRDRSRSRSPSHHPRNNPSHRSHRSRSPSRERGGSYGSHSSQDSTHRSSGHRSSRGSDDRGGRDSGFASEEESRTRRNPPSYECGTAPKAPHIGILSRYGRHYGRTVELWRPFNCIIDIGGQPEPEADNNEDPGFVPDEVFVDLYKQLCRTCPILKEEIKERGKVEVASKLDTARCNARGEDVKRIKDLVNELYTFEPPLNKKKGTRGYNHFQAGRLLLPHSRIAEYDTDAEFRTRLKAGTEVMNPRDYSIFLYEDHIVNEFNILDGFLRGKMLVRAFRMVFQGPSSVDGKGPSARATKKGNAERNSMIKITIPAIAYIATLVHFALDSTASFTAGGDHGNFDNNAFYRSIIDLLMVPPMAPFRKELLKWWNNQVFPNREPEQVDDGNTVHAQMLALLQAQLDAAAAEAEAAAVNGAVAGTAGVPGTAGGAA